jgi:8-oxo-dGTP diphosphatase
VEWCGGRIEPGEDPAACMLREIYEETGCRLLSVRFAGCLTWEGFEIPAGGLVIYTAEIQEGFDPAPCDEGHLAWKSQDWVLSSPEVVSNIHRFGPAIFAGEAPVLHHFVYSGGEIIKYQRLPILNETNMG